MVSISLIRNLGIDESEFNFQFQSHPNYPSALALSDTLNFLGYQEIVKIDELNFVGLVDAFFM